MILYTAGLYLCMGLAIGFCLTVIGFWFSFRRLFFFAHRRIAKTYSRRGEWERALHVRASEALCEGVWPEDATYPPSDDEHEPPEPPDNGYHAH